MPALCEKWAILDPFPPMAKVTAATTVFPYAGLLRFLLSPKTQIKSCFTLKMPGLLSKSAAFALRTHASLVVGGLQSGHGSLKGACAETPPESPVALYCFILGEARSGQWVVA